jgi:hypothetical protein
MNSSSSAFSVRTRIGLTRNNRTTSKETTTTTTTTEARKTTTKQLKKKKRLTKAMASSSAAASELKPAIIIGGGRVGKALFDMGENKGDVVLRREDEFPKIPKEGPIFVCTRNAELEKVIEKTPGHRRKDLVFLQNGMLETYLDSKGLAKNTQCLIYFACAKLGEKPIDGITTVNPEGLTATTGVWAEEVAKRFHNGNLTCHVKDYDSYRASMFEKLIWISSFMLVGAQHPGATVGDVAKAHKNEVEALIVELVKGVSNVLNVTFEAGTLERLLAYADSVAHFPTAVKEFEWRNGFFYSLSLKETQGSNEDPFPIHTQLLKNINLV